MYAPDSNVVQAVEPPAPGEPAVTIRDNAANDWRLHPPKRETVAELTGLLRERRRWRDVPASADRVARRCRAVLAELGVPDAVLPLMADAGRLEVELGVQQTDAIKFPWEFVIAESTRDYRYANARRSLLIVRHVTDGAAKDPQEPSSLLIVESAPGDLGEHYSFASERSCVVNGLGLDPTILSNPDADTIRETVERLQPSVVHFTGVDAEQGAELLRRGGGLSEHGVYLRDGDELRVTQVTEIAAMLTSAKRRPALVSFNVYNSSYLANLLVERGALASIGFQDVIDDAVAEKFFAAFYAAWRPKWDLFAAFDAAWGRLASHARELRGTGISLWGKCSIRDKLVWAPPIAAPPAEAGPAIEPETTTRPRAARARSPRAPVAGAPPAPAPVPTMPPPFPPQVGDPLSVLCTAPRRLNYSLLHNNLPLFPEFMLKCAGPQPCDVSVEVSLHAGVETARYEASFEVKPGDPINLASSDREEAIRVSLTSELARSLAESVYTSIVVNVKCNGHPKLLKTHRVELLAIDEWIDDGLNRQWLPSFVFPRDTAVRQIVDAAQRYLVALADDSGAGFDGYQSFDPDGPTFDDRTLGIDHQVQALWWAIISEFNLAYINPPPTFTEKSQRLRTPSEVLAGRRGTCIDLTLLLAACLEYVDIYPVIFLLKDHAFPGYVRCEQSHDIIRDKFQTVVTQVPAQPPPGSATPTPGPGLIAASTGSARNTADFGWVVPASRFADVMKLVQAGHIVPIETVALTQRTGFQAAVDEGLQNLRDRRSFESLFDIRLSREGGVTPLPLWRTRV
jgi:hypothetical protein